MSGAPPSTWQAFVRPVHDAAKLYLAGVAIARAADWAERAGPRAVADWTGQPAEVLLALRTEKKRQDRLAGRIAARMALRACWPEGPLESIPLVEVREDGPRSGQPHLGAGLDQAWGISISHAGDRAVAVVGPPGVGIDIDEVAPRGEAFLALTFSSAEREQVTRVADAWGLDEAGTVTLQWCAKEAVLKRLGVGLRAALQEVEVHVPAEPPGPLGLERMAGDLWSLLPLTRACTVWVRYGEDLEHLVRGARAEPLALYAASDGAYAYAVVQGSEARDAC